MGYTPIPTVICMILAALLQEPTSSQKLQPVLPVPICLSFPRALPAPASCIGPFCKPCKGSCKTKCGPNESSDAGYCGKGCQCCTQITFPLCLHGASCGKGGKCRNGISCPKGEKPISGTCGHTKTCICCAPDQSLECKPKAQCTADNDYCVEKLGTHGLSRACSKGYAKVFNACTKGSLTECDCCKKLGCSPNGDRCSGKGDFCIDYSKKCPAGYRETQDCSKPHIENGVYYKSTICKCCKPLANDVKPGGCPLLPAAPPGSSLFDNTDPASGCQGDMDCPGVKKCCALGVCCARSCLDPCDPSEPWCLGK